MNVFANAFSENPVKVQAPDDKPEEVEPRVEEPADAESEPAGSSPAQEPAQPEKTAEPSQTQGTEAKPKVDTVPHAAFHAEKERRRAVEAELNQLKSNKQKTSVLDDEDKAFQERLSEATRPLIVKLFNQSVAAAKRQPGREDFDEVYAFLEQEVQQHPELMAQIDQADDPGETIYRLGKTRKELAAVGGDITKLREHVTKEVQAELSTAKERIKALEAENARLKGSEEKRQKIPSSLNTEQSGSPKEDVFSGPTPLKKVLQN